MELEGNHKERGVGSKSPHPFAQNEKMYPKNKTNIEKRWWNGIRRVWAKTARV